MSEFILIGKVGKAHGHRGHFYIRGRDEPLEEDWQGKDIFIGSTSKAFKILEIRNSRDPIVLVENISSKESVSDVTGDSIWIQRSHLSLNPDEEYLWEDLMGKEIYDRNSQLVGRVSDVMNHGASDIVEVKREGSKVLIPFVKDYFRMDFDNAGDRLELVVDQSVFDDLWETL